MTETDSELMRQYANILDEGATGKMLAGFSIASIIPFLLAHYTGNQIPSDSISSIVNDESIFKYKVNQEEVEYLNELNVDIKNLNYDAWKEEVLTKDEEGGKQLSILDKTNREKILITYFVGKLFGIPTNNYPTQIK